MFNSRVFMKLENFFKKGKKKTVSILILLPEQMDVSGWGSPWMVSTTAHKGTPGHRPRGHLKGICQARGPTPAVKRVALQCTEACCHSTFTGELPSAGETRRPHECLCNRVQSILRKHTHFFHNCLSLPYSSKTPRSSSLTHAPMPSANS